MAAESSSESWKEQTSAFDRVWTIASVLPEPQPASVIADEAHVAENTARKHLDRLTDMYLLQTHTEDGTTMYAPEPLYTRMRTLREFLDNFDHDGLIEKKANLQERIEEWKDEYSVESPEELREEASQTEQAQKTREISKVASDWELALYRISILEEAIEKYEMYTQTIN